MQMKIIGYEEQERFCFRAVVSEKGVFLYRQVSYGWEDQIFRTKRVGWIQIPLSEEDTLRAEGLKLEERKQFAKEKLMELKQPKPVKQRGKLQAKGAEKCRYPLENCPDSEMLREKYEFFFREYGGLLTESYCILHYGEQKGKRYDRLFYSAMNPYGFPLDAHSGEYYGGGLFHDIWQTAHVDGV